MNFLPTAAHTIWGALIGRLIHRTSPPRTVLRTLIGLGLLGIIVGYGLDLAGLLVATWIILVGATGYSSFAAVVTLSLAPIFTCFIKPLYTIPVSMLSLLIVFRHRQNILRLWQGKESKVWDKTKKPE